MCGSEQIANERTRQILQELHTPDQDDAYIRQELIAAAYAYIREDRSYWPWMQGFNPKDRISNLVKAGALIAAEIDRLNRATKTCQSCGAKTVMHHGVRCDEESVRGFNGINFTNVQRIHTCSVK
jgi:hypothetical protein